MKGNSLVLSSQGVALSKTRGVVEYLLPEEVNQIADSIKDERNGERNSLLILTLFQTGLRISEALSLTPRKISRYNGGHILHILGKGKKARMVACPENLANRLQAFAYQKELKLDDRIFPFNRTRGFQIVKGAALKAGITKRVYPHLFRHSDAIERLRQTGNPKALQVHLGHASFLMTMRYLSTLSAEDSLRIQQKVRFEDERN